MAMASGRCPYLYLALLLGAFVFFFFKSDEGLLGRIYAHKHKCDNNLWLTRKKTFSSLVFGSILLWLHLSNNNKTKKEICYESLSISFLAFFFHGFGLFSGWRVGWFLNRIHIYVVI